MEETEEIKENEEMIEEQKEKQRQQNFEEMKRERINEINQLENWTQLKCKEILFDSIIDNWYQCSSTFISKIIGKDKLAFLNEDIDGEKFGYYLDTEVKEEYEKGNETNSNSFLFNLNSKGRLRVPMKYTIKNGRLEGYRYKLYKQETKELIDLGDIKLFKENWNDYSYYHQNIWNFNYNGVDKAFSNNQPNDFGNINFSIKRLIVIQMEFVESPLNLQFINPFGNINGNSFGFNPFNNNDDNNKSSNTFTNPFSNDNQSQTSNSFVNPFGSSSQQTDETNQQQNSFFNPFGSSSSSNQSQQSNIISVWNFDGIFKSNN